MLVIEIAAGVVLGYAVIAIGTEPLCRFIDWWQYGRWVQHPTARPLERAEREYREPY